jgi:hypothetical protein
MFRLLSRFLLLCLVGGTAAFATIKNVNNIKNVDAGMNTVNASSPESYARNIIGNSMVSASTNTALSLSASSDPDGEHEKNENIQTLLDSALNADSDMASKLLDIISSLRKENKQEELTKVLDDIIHRVDGGKPVWTKLRITSKFSRRSRLAALSRLLDISTPEASDNADDTDDAKKSRRKRALVIALRSIIVSEESAENEGDAKVVKGVPIYMIEKAARKDLKEASSIDMSSRLPPGLETPKYDVIVKRPKFEIREYESFAVCSVTMTKPRPDAITTDQKISQPQLSGASSFGALAGYLFGKNQQETAMKMTTPVLTTGDGDEKEMAFVLPSTYWDEDALSKAPSPLENSLVQLKRENGGQRAVVMFGGLASSKEVKAKKQQLMKSLEADKEWCVSPNAPITLAQYNDPFTPPWKRLNEVSVPVQPST